MSRTLTGAAAMAAAAVAVALGVPAAVEEAGGLLRRAIVAAATASEGAGVAGTSRGGAPLELAGALVEALGSIARLSLAPALAAAGGALGAGLLQTGGLIAPGVLRPRWERVDPARGFGRLLGPGALPTALLPAGQAAATVAVGGMVLLGLAPSLVRLPRLAPGGAAAVVAAAARAEFLAVLGLLAAAGSAGLVLARWRHHRALRMTRAEVERDLREDQGDPRLRAERRRRHRAAPEGTARPRAACLVVNPTHLAVALGHRRGSDEAPVVLAKASGPGAASLRRVARRAALPVVRDVALARALWTLADVGDSIPEELYDAAAAVLAHVYARSPAEGP